MTESKPGLVGKLAFLHTTRLPLWVSLILVGALIFVYAAQQLAAKRAETRVAEERAALIAEAKTRTAGALDAAERRFALTLSWAVRGEMLRNNLDQIDQYFAEIVRLPGYKLALLVAPDGKVQVATDRRYAGAAASTLVPAALVNAGDITLQAEAGSVRWVAIPVMGLNSRIGTVLLRVERSDPLAGL